MSPTDEPNTPESRDKATSRLRTLTRGAVFAAAGATVVIGVVVSRDHPGSGSTGKVTTTTGSSSGSGSTSGASTTTGGSSGTSGTTGTTGNTGTTGTTGTTGNTGTSSSTPSASQSTPTVTSGGSSR
ncbi:MAG: hypothetical protein ABSB68_18065 [Acidimicrobiales bacterium]|jgi:hypothetical protein